MASSKTQQRHTKAKTQRIERDSRKRAILEAKNAIQQFDLALQMIEHWNSGVMKFRLESSHILHLHKIALDGIDVFAGTFRNGPVKIGASKHVPPDAFQVGTLVADMCAYVNKSWRRKTPLHLCAFVMWRLNWIHPFTDGNGRTTRAIAYVVLCARLGYRLPGQTTVPELIAGNKKPYYDALEQADRAEQSSRIDVSAMEKLLSDLLAKQLVDIHKQATDAKAKRSEAKKKFH